MSDRLFLYLSRIIILLVAIPVHETAHAYVSYKLGDPTAKMMGRLTLNPIKHFDPIGGLCMLLTGIGWAKPVPIDPRYYVDRKKGMALSALAGPVSNFIMAFVSMILMKFTGYLYYYSSVPNWFYNVYLVFYYMTVINITLGVFNLIPVPPFDGSRIMLLFLPERTYFEIMKYERYIFIGLFVLLNAGILDTPLALANHFLFSLMDTGTGFVDRLVSLLVMRRFV